MAESMKNKTGGAFSLEEDYDEYQDDQIVDEGASAAEEKMAAKQEPILQQKSVLPPSIQPDKTTPKQQKFAPAAVAEKSSHEKTVLQNADRANLNTQDLDLEVKKRTINSSEQQQETINTQKNNSPSQQQTVWQRPSPQLPPPQAPQQLEGIPLPFTHEELDKELFALFDMDGSGYIEVKDLEGIGRAMGWQNGQVRDLIQAIDPNHDGRISFDEFLLILRHIEERLQQNQSSLTTNQSRMSYGFPKLATASSVFMSDTDRKMYDALLPKQGVYFLPDDKLIAFLKVMNELRKKCEREGDYGQAKRLRDRFEELRSVEALRQTENMRIAQEQELATIEGAQKVQFQEFNDAWDKYMADYESAAFESVEQLKEKHIQELAELSQRILEEAKVKSKTSKELLDLRRQEKIFFSVKDYEKAELTRQKADLLEFREREASQDTISEELLKQERLLRKKQQLALGSLLKRIQRDREEQLRHRFEDAQRLMKRNANLLRDMLKKQTQEQRKTQQFLKYALGKREVKSDQEIMGELRAKAYQPQFDPLMPRIAKKYGGGQNNSQMSYMSGALNRNSTLGDTIQGKGQNSNRIQSQGSNILKASARQQLGLSPTTLPSLYGGESTFTSPEEKKKLNIMLHNTSSFKSPMGNNTRSLLLNKKESTVIAKQQKYQNKLFENSQKESIVQLEINDILSQLPTRVQQDRLAAAENLSQAFMNETQSFGGSKIGGPGKVVANSGGSFA